MSVKIKQSLKICGHGPKIKFAYILFIDRAMSAGKGNQVDLSKYVLFKKNKTENYLRPN